MKVNCMDYDWAIALLSEVPRNSGGGGGGGGGGLCVKLPLKVNVFVDFPVFN